MTLGLSLLRALIGALFFGHGTQKLFGWFGGHGPDATGQFFEQLGLRPGKQHAMAAGAAEAGGGALLALGLATPVASATLIGTMATAVRTVHGSKGPWVSDGGWEYNAVLIAALVALADAGPGRLSLDHARGKAHRGPFWALVAVAGGLAGAAAVDAVGQRTASPEPVIAPASDGSPDPVAPAA